ncbi:Oidioi.mRNA.OKI2018_I69.chr1.g311.t1.cds [Oikopleura dioica]|uniref:Oidioi.mRNA.OKI2018_I69.chr1.g311.t1.cds n=1 Tax=Oikopleura dioica TaxID=34765 RepID=A0ABN7SJF8_OIKDI|nr:Oidioi.mRNA.OKI2018_I69.chr1.g311.t1.cds [Oikopleura dioica]
MSYNDSRYWYEPGQGNLSDSGYHDQSQRNDVLQQRVIALENEVRWLKNELEQLKRGMQNQQNNRADDPQAQFLRQLSEMALHSDQTQRPGRTSSSTRTNQEITDSFGLHKKQIEILQDKGCLGHFNEIDASPTHGGKKPFDRSCMALILQAMDNGLKDFTIKGGHSANILEVGESMMIITNEKEERTLLPQWTTHISIFHKGKYVRFKAKCFVIDAYAGFVQKEYDWKETNSDGHYIQLILPTDFPDCAFNYRFHVTIL